MKAPQVQTVSVVIIAVLEHVYRILRDILMEGDSGKTGGFVQTVDNEREFSAA